MNDAAILLENTKQVLSEIKTASLSTASKLKSGDIFLVATYNEGAFFVLAHKDEFVAVRLSNYNIYTHPYPEDTYPVLINSTFDIDSSILRGVPIKYVGSLAKAFYTIEKECFGKWPS